jgi:hypothetical protein
MAQRFNSTGRYGSAQWFALVFTVLGWVLTAIFAAGLAVRRQ